MAKSPANPDKPSTVAELLGPFDYASLKVRAKFARSRFGVMVEVLQAIYGKAMSTDPRAKPLQVLRGGHPHRHVIASLDGGRLSSGDILELLIGVPEQWLTVWIDGLPERVHACILTPYEVSRIDLNERSFLRWPDKPVPALSRFVDHLEDDPRGETNDVQPSRPTDRPDVEAFTR